jgi:hypothetical protein
MLPWSAVSYTAGGYLDLQALWQLCASEYYILHRARAEAACCDSFAQPPDLGKFCDSDKHHPEKAMSNLLSTAQLQHVTEFSTVPSKYLAVSVNCNCGNR